MRKNNYHPRERNGGYKDGAVFVWTPNNSTNNTILSICCYFRYRNEIGNELRFRIDVDFNELQYQLIGDLTECANIDNCIYDLTLVDDPTQINNVIRRIVSIDYHNKARIKLVTDGQIVNWTLV